MIDPTLDLQACRSYKSSPDIYYVGIETPTVGPFPLSGPGCREMFSRQLGLPQLIYGASDNFPTAGPSGSKRVCVGSTFRQLPVGKNFWVGGWTVGDRRKMGPTAGVGNPPLLLGVSW